MRTNNKIINRYYQLKKQYIHHKGQWSLWQKRHKTELEKEEIIIGAILTQQTNWNNVSIAIKNLKTANLLSLKSIYNKFLNTENAQELIRPAGFYKQKTEYLLNTVRFIIEEYKTLKKMEKAPLEKLREELLKIKGIGEETADSILLYALEKPVFVIDEYTKRFCKKHNLSDKFSYSHLQNLFEKSIPKDYKLYQDYHALIVIDGKL
ncbi:MAG: endonuclease [bacterium]